MNMCKPLMLFLVLITNMVIGYHQTLAQCLPVIANDTDNSLCEGEALTLTAAITLPEGCILGGGAPYIWAGPSAPGATGFPQITIPAAAAGDYSVAVAVAQDGTPGAPACPCVGVQGASNIVTVNPTPIVPTIGATSVEICEGDNLELLYTGPPVPGGTFAWAGPNGFSSTSQDPIIFDVPAANTGAYTLTITDGNGCTSPVSIPLEVVVSAKPVITDAPAVDFCPGYPAILEVVGVGTINWYDAPLGGTPLFTGTPYETQILNQTTIFYAELVDDVTGCISDRVAVTANMLGPIAKPVARDTIVCEGDPATLSAVGTGTAGNSLLWYDVPFDGVPIETDLMLPAAHTYTTPFGLLTTTTFYVAELDALTGCESERTAIKVVVNPEVPEPVGLDIEACEGDPITVSATHGAGSNLGDFYWFDAPTGGTLLGVGQNLSIPADLIATAGSYNFYVEERFNECISPTREEVTVTINANPSAPTGTPEDVCEGEVATLTAEGTAGNTLNWYGDAQGNNLLFTGASFETPALNQTTTFWVRQENPATGCVSEFVAVNANVQPIPQTPSATDMTVCNDETIVITASGSGTASTQLNLYADLDDTTPLLSSTMPPANVDFELGNLAAGTYTYYVEEQNLITGCVSARVPVTIIVEAAATAPNVVDPTICEGSSVTLTATSSNGTIGVFNWYADAGLTNLLGTGSSFTTATLSATTEFYVTQASGVCESPATIVTVTVNPQPNAPTVIVPTAVCVGNTVTFTAAGSGGILNWYSDGAGTNLVGTGATLTTPALTQSTTFWVQEVTIGTGCVSELSPVTVEVTPGPAAPSANDITICENTIGEITAAGSGTGSLVWYDVATDGTPLQTNAMPPASATFEVGPLTAGSYVYYVAEDNGECESERTAVTVTVTPTPVAPNVQSPVAICEGEDVSMTASSATNGTFNWYDVDGNLLFTGTTYTATNLIATTSFTVTETINDCESVGATITVNVNPTLEAPIATSGTACEGETVELSATAAAGFILNWFGDNAGSNLLGSGNTLTTPALTQTTTFWVQAFDPTTGCSSELVAVSAMIVPAPTAPSADGITICEGETGQILATGSGAGSLVWYDVASGGTAIQTDAAASLMLEVGPLTAGSYVYYVAEDNGQCESARTAVSVTVNATPDAPNVQSPVAICEGENVSLTASSTTNGIFNWYDAEGNLVFTGATYTVVNLVATTSFTVKETVNGCESAGATVTVNVNPTLAAPTATAGIACEGETAELTAATSGGLLLNWYDDNGGSNLLGSGTSFTTPALTQTTTFWVQAFDPTTGCASELVPVSAIVVPTPAAPSVDGIEICEGEVSLILATGSGAGSLAWYNLPTGGTPLQTDATSPSTLEVGPLPVGTYTYYVEEVSNGCVSNRTAVTVTVKPTPVAPTVNAPIATCEGETATMVATSATNGTFLWYDATGTNLLFTGSTYITPPLTQTTNYIVKETVNGCASVGELVVVNVNPKPANPLVTPANLCLGAQTDLLASADAGLFLNWYSDNTGSNLLFTGTTFTTPLLTQTTTYWVQAINPTTGCTSDFVPVVATVLEVPTAPSAAGITICEGEIGEIVASGSGEGTISWYTVAEAGAAIQEDVMPPSEAMLSVGPLPAGTYTYYIEESNGICVSSRTPVTVIVNPTPAPPSVQAPIATCMGGTASMTATSTTNGTFNWYDTSGTTLLYTGSTYISEPLMETATFQVTEVVGGCESGFTEILVNVNPLPMTPFVAPVTVCQGTSATISATPAVGNTLNWYSDASASTLLFSGNDFVTPVLNQTTIFYVREMNGTTSCVSELVAVTVTVESLPVAPTAEDITICEGETGEIVVSGSGVGILNWYDEATDGTPLQTLGMPPATASYTVGPLVAGTYVYYVAEENTDCESERTAVTVTVLPAPVAPIAPGIAICENEQTTLTATSNGGGNGEFNWYSDDAANNLLYVGNNYPTGVLSATTTFYVSEVVGNCESTITPVTVIVNPLPGNPVVDAATSCEGESISLTAIAESGTVVNWYSDPNTTNLLGTGNTFDTPSLIQNTTFWVQATVAGTGCKSEVVPVNISVQPTPVAPSVVGTTICVGEQGTITAIGTGNGSLKWYDSPISVNPIQTDDMPPSSATLEVGPFAIEGTFIFYVEEESNGCTSERVAVSVTVAPMPGAPIVTGATICEGESATLTATRSTAAQGIFNWYDESGTELLGTGQNFNTGPLTVTTTYQVVESTEGCESPASFVVVTVNEQPIVPIVADVQVCEGTAATLTASASASNILSWYDDDSGSNLLGNGANFTTPELTQTTTFWVGQITPNTGCSSELTPVTVTVIPAPTPPSATDITICENEVGTITASGSGNGFLVWFEQLQPDGTPQSPPLQFSPMPPAFATLNVGPFVPNVYVLYVAEDNGTCISSPTPVTVRVVPTPEAPIASGATVCEGESALLSATSSNGTNGDFNWYDVTGDMLLYTGGTFNTGALTQTTSYLVRELNNGCEGPTTLVTVVVNPAPEILVVDDVVICEGETATIEATAPVGQFVNWYNDPTGSNLLFTGATFTTTELTQTTTFWVNTLVVGTGCSSELVPVTVDVAPVPTMPSTTNVTVCEGESALLVASGTGNPNTELRWFEDVNNETPLQVDVMSPTTSASFDAGIFAPGTYTFYVSEFNTVSGCGSPRTAVEVIVTPKPAEPSVDDLEICFGETVTIEAPGTGVFKWYDAQVDGNLLQVGLSYTTPVLTQTTSFFITQEVNGCESDREEVVVTVNPLPESPTISSNAPLCEGETLDLKASTVPNVSYVWTGPNEYESTLQNPVIENVTEADHQGTYTLNVIDNTTGCVSEGASVFVEIHPLPQTPSITSNSPVCAGDDLVLTAGEVFGTSTYIWVLPDSSIIETAEPTLTISEIGVEGSGTYGVGISINGCSSGLATVDVTVIGLGSIPVVNSNSPVCEGDDIILMTDAVSGGIYQWSGPNDFSSNAQNPIIESATLANMGTYELMVTISGCETSMPGSGFVEVVPGPVLAGITSNSPVCQGEAIVLDAPFVPNASYTWFDEDGDEVGNERTLMIEGAVQSLHQGTYTLAVTDTISGCSASAETRVFVDGGTGLIILAENNGPVCEGEEAQFTVTVTPAQPGATYEWYAPNGDLLSTDQNPVITEVDTSDAGVYIVLVDGNSGCLAGSMNSTTLEVSPALNVDAGPDVTITQGESVKLSATGADLYSWTPVIYLDNGNVPNPEATPPVGEFEYVVTGMSIDGCVATDTVVITVEPQVDVLGVYDLFTPNGDGVNDTFVIEFIANLESYTLSIYNRGGVELVSTSNYQNDWDGTYRGRDVPEGTYWYVIRTNEGKEYKGAVTLIR